MLNKKATAIREVLQTVGSRGRIFGVTFVKADGQYTEDDCPVGCYKVPEGYWYTDYYQTRESCSVRYGYS